jgi:hypothetical protein
MSNVQQGHPANNDLILLVVYFLMPSLQKFGHSRQIQVNYKALSLMEKLFFLEKAYNKLSNFWAILQWRYTFDYSEEVINSFSILLGCQHLVYFI